VDFPIELRDEQGRRMWAFNPQTDPYKVLHTLSWAWAAQPEDRAKYIAPGRSLCGSSCPFVDGGYCLDCHGIAWTALQQARRWDAWKEWLVTGQVNWER